MTLPNANTWLDQYHRHKHSAPEAAAAYAVAYELANQRGTCYKCCECKDGCCRAEAAE